MLTSGTHRAPSCSPRAGPGALPTSYPSPQTIIPERWVAGDHEPLSSSRVPRCFHQTTDLHAITTTTAEMDSISENPGNPVAYEGSAGSGSGSRFSRDSGLPLHNDNAHSSSPGPLRLPMPNISPGQLAYSTMLYLPVPVLVLNDLKTVVLANEAMGRMLGIIEDSRNPHLGDASGALDKLRGQTLSQVGVDMLQDGRPVWVAWEEFLDTLVEGVGASNNVPDHLASQPGSFWEANGNVGSQSSTNTSPERRGSAAQRPNQDVVLEVVVTRKGIGRSILDASLKSKESEFQVFAKMIISVWEVEDGQTYFTLTFTSCLSKPSSMASTRKPVTRSNVLDAASRRSIPISTPTFLSSGRDVRSPSSRVSPSAHHLSSSPFPPLGPPSVASSSSTPSILQKLTMIKDALLDTTQMPILSMWKDGSVAVPNKAARNLLLTSYTGFDHSAANGFDLLSGWEVWDEDFTRRLAVEEYPISALLRTEQPFASRRIGMYDQQKNKLVFDVLGEAIRDEVSGEFLAGVVTGRDITKMTQEMTQIKEQDDERFKLICDSMPQLVWTSRPDGQPDFFNTRWYTYTGLTPEECMSGGRVWKQPFHPEDLPLADKRWGRSLETGEPFMAEYRCRNKDGEWRWHLGRAVPLRSKQTGEIEKWLGTCTDVHEAMEAKLNATRTGHQLLSVIAHARVTLFTVDVRRNVTMLQGALIQDATMGHTSSANGPEWWTGENMYKVFNRLNSQLPAGERPSFLQPIEEIFEGNSTGATEEHTIDKRWYRTRFVPISGKDGKTCSAGEGCIDGVIGVIMDVTELKLREAAIKKQSREKQQALANEATAKEANQLKSQFLANMSHEIRTPISGVLGMAELLQGMTLETEQSECVDNIYRSANALLTVINDILDFSKVESGRLDIEELPFKLSIIVDDVCMMLKFPAERKNLDFQSVISDDLEDSLVVLGDPGRVRQIITNLLTNSIKFTNQGFVRFSVVKERETDDTVEIKFVVEDSGIGIEDEVRKKLFQPFSQGDASTARCFGGTGLGLTICKNLLDLMNGRITLESTVGCGTTATFWIPFHKGPQDESLVEFKAVPSRLQSDVSVSCNGSDYNQAVSAPTPYSQSGLKPDRDDSLPCLSKSTVVPQSSSSLMDRNLTEAERSKIHVLVVEDNHINQQIAIKTIRNLGFGVSASWNGKEVLDYLESAQQRKARKPDIILMDVQMPVIDGYRCTHLLRHHTPYKAYVEDVPIVAMTASAIQGDRERCTRAGMDDYLAKPVKSKVLERMLVRWSLSRRVPPPPPSGQQQPNKVDMPLPGCSGAGESCINIEFRGKPTGKVVSPLPADDNGDGSGDGGRRPPAVHHARHGYMSDSINPLPPENVARIADGP